MSFELNDSCEELRIDYTSSMDNKEEAEQPVKFKDIAKPSRCENRSIEPLFSVSPKKEPLPGKFKNNNYDL